MDFDQEKLCWQREECNRLPCTHDLPSLKAQFSEFELRIPKLAKQSVSEPTNLLFLYQPWILCDSQREREFEELEIQEGKAVSVACLYTVQVLSIQAVDPFDGVYQKFWTIED